MVSNLHFNKFDPAKVVIFDAEVFPDRWSCGFMLTSGSTHVYIDGDRDLLAKALTGIAATGATLIGFNSAAYDLPILRAVLANTDPHPVSQSIVHHDGPGVPEVVRVAAARWPAIKADVVDLAARVRQAGRIPSLKTIATNLGVKHLQELPFDPTQPLSDAEWHAVRQYNKKDLEATKAVLDHFTPELEALAALSARFGTDLRNVHPAGVAGAILCKGYRDRVGRDPVKIAPPATIRYTPPRPVRRPRNSTAAAWFDRLTTEKFPLAFGQSLPVVPAPDGPIIIDGVELSVGSGGVHSVDRPALHRHGEQQIYEADVQSYYPSMMARFGIFPRTLGDVGLAQFRAILAERLRIKDLAVAAEGRGESDEAKRRKTQSAGMKLFLNSLFGQTGNPYSTLYDPEAFLAVTLTGQLLMIGLIERLIDAGAKVLSVNTDGMYLKVREDNDRWTETIDNWEAGTGMTLEVNPIEALVVEATNNYATRLPHSATGKRRGTLSDAVAWNRVPNGRVVADAVLAALFDGTLPETTVKECVDPTKFVNITRRDSTKAGYLIDEATGTETPLPRICRWYRATGSHQRIEHRWTDEAGKTHKTTPPGATDVRLMMDLPAKVPDDVDVSWYAGEARIRILANRDFAHLDPKWLAGHATPLDLYHNKGLFPCPKQEGVRLPEGPPSFFWDWNQYDAFGTYTGPEVSILVLDVVNSPKFHKWLDVVVVGTGCWQPAASLGECLVSHGRGASPEVVRAGANRGKLIFKFAADPNHPLARVGGGTLRATIGCAVYYGKGVPTVVGPWLRDVPWSECVLGGVLGPPPDWLINDLTARATKKVRTPKAKATRGGKGCPTDSAARRSPDTCPTPRSPTCEIESDATALVRVVPEAEVAKVAAVPEAEVTKVAADPSDPPHPAGQACTLVTSSAGSRSTPRHPTSLLVGMVDLRVVSIDSVPAGLTAGERNCTILKASGAPGGRVEEEALNRVVQFKVLQIGRLNR